MADVLRTNRQNVTDFAPPGHPNRVSATSRIMCEAIEKVFADTASGIDERVSELKQKVEEIDAGVEGFKKAMRAAADGLVSRVQEVMAQYEDITAKMQQSPFNGDLPQFLEQQNALE